MLRGMASLLTNEITLQTSRGTSITQPDFGGALPIVNGQIRGRLSIYRYGAQGILLVAADVDDATDKAITALSGVLRIPDNLDQQVGAGGLTIVRNALETRNIPGNWVQAGTTYRALLRVALGAFTLLQRYRAISGNMGKVLQGAVTLNTVFSTLSQQTRDYLLATASSLKLDITGLTGDLTLRQILKAVGDQFANQVFHIGGITI